MNRDELSLSAPLDFPGRDESHHWALAGLGELEGGDCFVASVATSAAGGESPEVVGRFHAATGNVLASGETPETESPAVLCVGDPAGATGQLKSRQPAGNYLRVCRWDRIVDDAAKPPSQPDAQFRTLPQCGCGGYLGTPKFFDTFAAMAAYVFCMFFDPGDDASCPV